jgi:hypothetical protein
LRYKANEGKGDPNAPNDYETAEEYQLGTWQRALRQNYKNGKLPSDRIARLEEIVFKWEMQDEQREEQFKKGFQETLRYKANEGNGDPNAKVTYETAEGYRLGSWQSALKVKYKKGKLFPDRIKRLEDIGFKWEIKKEQNDEQFEKGFQETLRFKANEGKGDPNAKYTYKTDEGYRLGTWQGNQKQNYKKGILSLDKIRRLEEIGFTWERFEEQFEKGFQETLDYKANAGNGDPNAPTNYRSVEGFRLGTWQSTLKYLCKKKRLPSDRIVRLEEIGFKWEVKDEQREEQFEKGFQETLRYKNSTGNPNAPNGYETAEGFKLRLWQNTKRSTYRQGKLSPERIKRLEEIGFKWGKKR